MPGESRTTYPVDLRRSRRAGRVAPVASCTLRADRCGLVARHDLPTQALGPGVHGENAHRPRSPGHLQRLSWTQSTEYKGLRLDGRMEQLVERPGSRQML